MLELESAVVELDILISRAVVVIVIVVIVAIEGSRSRAAVRLNYKPEPAAPYRKQLNDIQETPTIKKNTPDELTLQTHPPRILSIL